MRMKGLAICLSVLLLCAACAQGEQLPQLRLETSRLNYFVYRDGTLTLTDSCGSEASFPIRVRYRGSTSAFYEGKRNYRVTLGNETQPLKRSLLGLRKDDDWLLDGMYGDLSRLRNRTAMDLWDDIYRLPWTDASGAIAGNVVELWFNDIYKGIYALNERLDRKQLGLCASGGCIYKTFNPSMEGIDLTDFQRDDILYPQPEDSAWYNVEIHWQGDLQDPWAPFVSLWNFVSQADDEQFAREIDRYLDLDNCVDYYLFINMLGCSDNMCKNMVFCVRDAAEDTRLYLVPWDLDACLGRLYDNQKAAADMVCTNGLFERLMAVPAFMEKLTARYTELRGGALSVQNVRQAM